MRLSATRLKLAAARAAYARLMGIVLPPELQYVVQQPFRLLKTTGAKRYRPNPRGYYGPNGPKPVARRLKQQQRDA